MTIREATGDDKHRLVEMAARFLLETPYGRLFDDKATPDTIARLIDQVLTFGAIFVAEETGPGRYGRTALKLTGMLAIVVVPHPLTGRNYAEEIAWWVEPEHRIGRVGPNLLRSAEEWATTKGANMCKMVAPEGSSVGGFYERLGYQPVETAYLKRL